MIQSVVPTMFMLAMPWLDRKRVLLAWPLTHLPDLDYLLADHRYHRALGHNVFLILPFVVVGLWAWRNARPSLAQWMLIATIYIASHDAMDVFAGGVTLFYPLSLHTSCYYAQIDVVTATTTPVIDAGRCSFEGVPVVSTVYEWLPSEDAALLAFLVPATILVVAWRVYARKKGMRTRSG